MQFPNRSIHRCRLNPRWHIVRTWSPAGRMISQHTFATYATALHEAAK